jgi:hypothetical protein
MGRRTIDILLDNFFKSAEKLVEITGLSLNLMQRFGAILSVS